MSKFLFWNESELRNIHNILYDDKTGFSEFDDENPYDDANVFLHGSCELFALALNKKYGYPIYALQNSQGDKVHFFCIKKLDGNDVFIDVRGITENVNDIISGMHLIDGKYSIVPIEVQELGIYKYHEMYGISFAIQIIERNSRRYNIKK